MKIKKYKQPSGVIQKAVTISQLPYAVVNALNNLRKATTDRKTSEDIMNLLELYNNTTRPIDLQSFGILLIPSHDVETKLNSLIYGLFK